MGTGQTGLAGYCYNVISDALYWNNNWRTSHTDKGGMGFKDVVRERGVWPIWAKGVSVPYSKNAREGAKRLLYLLLTVYLFKVILGRVRKDK